MNKPDAILTSDWHLREDTPVCRVDNFWEVQWVKLRWIQKLQDKYNCFVLHAGDLFHHWKPSPYLLSYVIEHLPDQFATVYGQHDLPQHSLELKEKSGINVIESANWLTVLDGCSWGQTPVAPSLEIKGRKILVWHNFTYMGKDPWPGITSPKAYMLLEKYKQFDLIVTGDNHQSFTFKSPDGHLLVNPGSLTRQDADQIDFKPKVYLWYAETNTVEAVEIPIDTNAVTRVHIEKLQERTDRIDAFTRSLQTDFTSTVSFEKNMEIFLQNNRIRKDVKDIIYKAMDI
jgi:DNA repair exonuclease SbcCD nuclease subunit